MGGDRYNRAVYNTYIDTYSLQDATREEVFSSRHLNQALDPAKIKVRESCDSEANPNSTPVILALDVTGSMGFIAESIAKGGLPKVMEGIYEERPITDPHLMFMGIGDVTRGDQAPLQVSQFEAGALPLIEQLRTIWLEGGGGGNHFESYNLPWYFAANKTAIDSFTKRQQKGYLFTIGDELPPEPLKEEELKRVLGPGQHDRKRTLKEELDEVQKMYKVFHIIAEQGSYAHGNERAVNDRWVDFLGPNVIRMRDQKYLPEIVIATLKIANGADMNAVIHESKHPEELRYAFSNAKEQ